MPSCSPVCAAASRLLHPGTRLAPRLPGCLGDREHACICASRPCAAALSRPRIALGRGCAGETAYGKWPFRSLDTMTTVVS